MFVEYKCKRSLRRNQIKKQLFLILFGNPSKQGNLFFTIFAKITKKGQKVDKIKLSKCKICGTKFQLFNSLRPYCSFECGAKYAMRLQTNKEKKDWKVKRAEIIERLLTHSDYLNMLQVVFNTFIRLRDANRPCISCGTINNVKYDAGHFYSRKGYSGVRFDEDNVHKQCSNNCNMHLSGNFAEYSIQLPLRIGQERYDALVQRRHQELRLSIPDIKEMIIKYKAKIKQCKAEIA